MEKEETIFSPQEEKKIRRKAKKRVAFKKHSMMYFLICLLLWLIWFFLFKGSTDESLRMNILKFCFFVSLVWGICLFAHYLFVYKWNKTLIEKEIKHLKKEQERKREEELNKLNYNN